MRSLSAHSRAAASLSHDRERLNRHMASKAAKAKEATEPVKAVTAPAVGTFRIPEGESQANALLDDELEGPKSEAEWIEELSGLYKVHPIEFARRLKAASADLGISEKSIQDEVKARRAQEPDGDKADPSQTQMLLTIGIGPDVELWHSPEKVGYASFKIDGHKVSCRIGSSEFGDRLRLKFGDMFRTKIGAQSAERTPA